jgi:hypothetical protein
MAFSEWKDRVKAVFTRREFNYTALPDDTDQRENEQRTAGWNQQHKIAIRLTGAVFILAAIGILGVSLTWVPCRPSPSLLSD